jgi:hypothetical protein
LKHNLRLTIQGSVEFNPKQKEWFCPQKLNQRWKRRNFAKTKLEKTNKLTKCLDCSKRIKPLNFPHHLIKIHHRKSRSQKRLRVCSKCQANYSTLIKRKEHQEFYCVKLTNYAQSN